MRLVEVSLAGGNRQRVELLVRPLLDSDPLLREGVGALMTIWQQSGGRHPLIRLNGRYAERLRRELGVPADLALRKLFRSATRLAARD